MKINKGEIMKKMIKYNSVYILVIVFILIIAGCSENSTNTSEVDKDPTGFYKIDVKTTFSNKYTATSVKNGLIGYMRTKGSKWCVDKEYGEDYSFWIKDVRSSSIGDSTIIRFDLELRTPALVTDGDSIDAIYGYSITYPNNPDWSKEGNADANKIAGHIKSILERNIFITKSAGSFIAKQSGVPQIKDMVEFLINTFGNEAKIQQAQVEGVIVGLIVYSEMRSMIKKNFEK